MEVEGEDGVRLVRGMGRGGGVSKRYGRWG